MSRISNHRIKIGVHWNNSITMGVSSLASTQSPRHPKLIELDSVRRRSWIIIYSTNQFAFLVQTVPLDDYITNICDEYVYHQRWFIYTHCVISYVDSWKIPQTNLVHFALRYDDTHKFVTEQVPSYYSYVFSIDAFQPIIVESFANSYWSSILPFPFACNILIWRAINSCVDSLSLIIINRKTRFEK
jgi:hypothetical protein